METPSTNISTGELICGRVSIDGLATFLCTKQPQDLGSYIRRDQGICKSQIATEYSSRY